MNTPIRILVGWSFAFAIATAAAAVNAKGAEHAVAQTREAPAATEGPRAQLFEGMGPHRRRVTTNSPAAQRYFEQGLAAAKRLGDLVPAAGHLLHMPSHIYVKTGCWNEAIVQNESAHDSRCQRLFRRRRDRVAAGTLARGRRVA